MREDLISHRFVKGQSRLFVVLGGLLLLYLAIISIRTPARAQTNGLLWQVTAADRIEAVALTDDGQKIAIGSRANNLRLFDRSGNLVWTFVAENSILGIDVAGDGHYTVVASEDRNLYLLDVHGQEVWRYRAARAMNNAAIADDGSLVVGTANDRSFYLLDSAGNLIRQQEVGIDVEAVTIYGNGENARVIVGSDDGVVAIYSRQGELLLSFQLDYDVQAVAVTPTGARIVAGTSDGRLHLLNGANGTQLWEYQMDQLVNDVDISHDGELILAGTRGGTVHLLRGDRQLVQSFTQPAEVLGVALSAEGHDLVLGTAAGVGSVINLQEAQAATAKARTRWHWTIGGATLSIMGLIFSGVWVVRRTPIGQQIWTRRMARPRHTLAQIWKARLSYLLLLPTLLLLLTFNYYPAFSGLYHAFTEWSPGARTEWIGLENFRFLLKDRFFWASFRNAIILVLVTIAKTLTVPLLVAELIFHVRHSHFRYWLRTLFIVPLILPLVVEILVWNHIYDPNIGLLNRTLMAFGLEEWTQVWYGDARVALASILFIGFPWVNAFAFLIYYGGLISISDEIFDAGKVDGASGWTRFWNIDLPLLMGQIKLLLILNFINAVQTFELVYLTTAGGPGASTYTPALELYYMAMRMDKLGVAAAIGMILFAIILIGTIFNMRLVRSSTEYEA